MKMRGKTQHRRRSKKQYKRSRKLQRAGAYIFEGSYGCAFGKPPLKCRGAASRRSNAFISKAMTDDSAIEEMRDAKKFFLLDPRKQYFLWPESICEYDNSDVTPEDEIDKCGGLTSVPPDYTHLLISENGGDNLAKVKPKWEDTYSFFASLLNLFDGLYLAHSKNIAHCDIKPANIVSIKKSDGRYHTRFIDFGLSQPTTPIKRTSATFMVFKSPYVYWPMETKFYSTYVINDIPTREKTIKNFYESFQYVKNTTVFNSYYTLDGIQKYDEASLKTVLDAIDYTKTEDALPNLDIYSLGITLAEVYRRFVPQHIKRRADGSYFAELPIKLHLASETNLQAVIDWNIQVQNRISIPLANLIYKMVHIIPARRPTLLAAKTEFEAILPAMRDLFQKEMMYKSMKITGALGEIPNPQTPTPLLSPTDLGKIQVSPVNVPARPHRDPRVAAVAAPAAPPPANEELMAFFNNVRPAAPAGNNLSYMYEN